MILDQAGENIRLQRFLSVQIIALPLLEKPTRCYAEEGDLPPLLGEMLDPVRSCELRSRGAPRIPG